MMEKEEGRKGSDRRWWEAKVRKRTSSTLLLLPKAFSRRTRSFASQPSASKRNSTSSLPLPLPSSLLPVMAFSSTLARTFVQSSSSSSVASSSSSSSFLLPSLRASLPSSTSSHLSHSLRTVSFSSHASSPLFSTPSTSSSLRRKRISQLDFPQPSLTSSSPSSSSLLLLASRRHLNSTPKPSTPTPLKPPNPTSPSPPASLEPTPPAQVTEPPSTAAVVVEKIKANNPLTVIGQTKDFFSLAPFDTTSKSKQEQEEEARGSYKKLWELLLPEKVSLEKEQTDVSACSARELPLFGYESSC